MLRFQGDFVCAVGPLFGVPLWIYVLNDIYAKGDLDLATALLLTIYCFIAGILFALSMWYTRFIWAPNSNNLEDKSKSFDDETK